MEGLLSEKPSCGSKKKMEELCEMMKKKHAMEGAKLLKVYEDVEERDLESENGTNEEVEEKDQEWKNKFEEIHTLMKEMSEGQKGKEDCKAKSGDFGRMDREVAHSNEPEKMLKEYAEVQAEELERQLRSVK